MVICLKGGYSSVFAAYKVTIHQKRECSFLPPWKTTASISYLSSYHRDTHVLYIYKYSIIGGKNELFWAYRCILEKALVTHSSTLVWKLSWTEEPGRLQSVGSLRVGHDWSTSLSLLLSCIGEGNGNPLQCSCLENPRDGGAWWAAVYGVTQSWTRLKWLSSSSSKVLGNSLSFFPGVPV